MTPLLRVLVLCLLVGMPACRSVSLGDSGLVPERGPLPPAGEALLLALGEAREPTGRPVAGSATTLGAALREVFRSYGWNLSGTRESDLAAGLAEAAELGCALLVRADYPFWQEAGAHWIETPDRVQVRVRLYRVSDGTLLAWGHDEVAGGTLLDAAHTAHRLVAPLVRNLLQPIFAGKLLSGVPEEDS